MFSLSEIVLRYLDFIAPRSCVMCGCRLAIGESVICSNCNLGLPRTCFVEHPYDNEMAKCFWGLIPIQRAAALYFFRRNSLSSRIIYKLKYHAHPEYGELMGRIIAEEFNLYGFFNGIDAIVPIPLAKKRQRERGYNQSLEIARGINEKTGLPIIRKAVKRKSFKGSQTHMNRWQRNENVKDEFILTDAEAVKGKHLLLVDDVVTSGATVCSCATELMKAGNVTFSVISLGFTKR